MIFKAIVILFLLSITYNLFRGLYFLVNSEGTSKDTARSLSWRIGLSLILFLILITLKLLGVVEPHTLQEGLLKSQEKQQHKATDDAAKSLEEIEKSVSPDGRVRVKP
ncbi:MAG: DUF2909 domain-containing protein [Pseudomonadales bacterium]|nr:DUF2909 domain-containing protein [Pseudomonadales bacterium]